MQIFKKVTLHHILEIVDYTGKSLKTRENLIEKQARNGEIINMLRAFAPSDLYISANW